MKGKDLLHLDRPNLGLYEIGGSTDNNIILMQCCKGDIEEEFDNFFVFVDENPACPADEKIKAIAQMVNRKKRFPGFRELWCYTSSDGIHFKLGWKISGGDEPYAGLFDSQNTVHYDKKEGVYKLYVRGLHMNYGPAVSAMTDGLITNDMLGALAEDGIRDIRYMESKDFRNWSIPEFLKYNDELDYPMYTNLVQKYERAPHMYIGIPTRYVERKEWGKNFEQLGGQENVRIRKERMKRSPRHGLAITDAIFMCSRDGKTWNRFHDAFIGAELEHAYNWSYGDAYIMYNLIETPCAYPSEETELSILAEERSGESAKVLCRYTIRKDGFASYHADHEVSTLVTKPFIFKGTELSINFATSALGYIYIDVLDETGKPFEGFHSCELFGNSLDRTVYFGDSSDVSKLVGRPVRLRFTMCSADLYSMIFR